MSNWTRVCSVSRLEEGEPFGVKLSEDQRIAVYLVDGEVYATDDVCPHAFALLSTGFLDGYNIECPLHGAVFDIRSGKCQGATHDNTRAFAAQIRDADVFVDLSPAGAD